jgi:predicted nucleotidyltransferase
LGYSQGSAFVWKSNPTFIEWIQSPITCIEAGGFAQGARLLLTSLHSGERGIHHYRSMAKTNYRGYLRGDTVPLKKYFYVLRPLLSVRWIERYATAPPIEFAKLLQLIQDQTELLADIRALLQKKSAAPELGLSEPVSSINAFVEAELERLELAPPQHAAKLISVAQLNELFHVTLREQT